MKNLQHNNTVVSTINVPKPGSTMTLYRCRDPGMECAFQMTKTTDNEIMREFIDHTASAHKTECCQPMVF